MCIRDRACIGTVGGEAVVVSACGSGFDACVLVFDSCGGVTQQNLLDHL